MGDLRGRLEDQLWQRVKAQMNDFDEVAERLTDAEKEELVRDATAAIVGPLIWRELLGNDRLETTQAATLLGITRQAINKRVQAHTLLGVPGRGTTWFPAWQFDMPNQTVRAVTERVLQQWGAAHLSESLPWDARRILSWAASRQAELDDLTPEQWILAGGDDEDVVAAARRAVKAAAA